VKECNTQQCVSRTKHFHLLAAVHHSDMKKVEQDTDIRTGKH